MPTWPSPRSEQLGTPNPPRNPFHAGQVFRGFPIHAFATACQVARSPVRIRPTRSAPGSFYFQASNGSVALPVAGYDYNSDWTPLLAGLSPARMAASLAAPDPDLTLSRHPARATARRLPPSIEYRVPPVAGRPDLKGDDPPPSLHGHYPASALQRNSLLRSPKAPMIHHLDTTDAAIFYQPFISLWVGKAGGELLRGSPPLSGASVLSASRLEPLVPCPLASPARFSRSVQVDHRHCRPAANETMLGYAVGIKPLAATA